MDEVHYKIEVAGPDTPLDLVSLVFTVNNLMADGTETSILECREQLDPGVRVSVSVGQDQVPFGPEVRGERVISRRSGSVTRRTQLTSPP